MDRRELLGVVGALGAGLTAGASESSAAEHGEKDKGAARYFAPTQGLHAHFCGIHIAKQNAKIQIVTQHFCGSLNEEMHQCLLFESCEKNAKLLGVEYIIADRLYRGLPEEEKKYWHPHTYEVLSGGLVSPGMEPQAEKQFMKALLTTWGKTWQTWPDPKTPLPIGEPLLMWGVTADGQLDETVVARRDKDFGISTAHIRERRLKEFGLEVPHVSLPKSIDQVGRQWTDDGDDKPTPRK
jgi:hypothetical protein